MTEFDFYELVRDVIETSDEADPRNLWKQVLDRVPEAEYVSVLDILGPGYVRNTAMKYSRRAETRTPVAPTATRRGRSYGRRIFVGEWKFLADCTAADLDFAVTLRHDQANAITAEADKYERLAKLCRERGVEKVGDLPEKEVEEALQ